MIAVCIKWVDAAGSPGDARFAGVSPSDEAALELALQQAEADGDGVVAVTAGPPAASRALRRALACGAATGVHLVTVAHPDDRQADSIDVARALAEIVADAATVWCGDMSIDRGSGSVPAFLAALGGRAQALGAIAVARTDGGFRVTRRLDGGRREVVLCAAPALISVEGAAARLRRATLRAVVAAETAALDSRPFDPGGATPALIHPFRPRAQAHEMPHGSVLDRLQQLLHGEAPPRRGETMTATPGEAAAAILQRLAEWGD